MNLTTLCIIAMTAISDVFLQILRDWLHRFVDPRDWAFSLHLISRAALDIFRCSVPYVPYNVSMFLHDANAYQFAVSRGFVPSVDALCCEIIPRAPLDVLRCMDRAHLQKNIERLRHRGLIGLIDEMKLTDDAPHLTIAISGNLQQVTDLLASRPIYRPREFMRHIVLSRDMEKFMLCSRQFPSEALIEAAYYGTIEMIDYLFDNKLSSLCSTTLTVSWRDVDPRILLRIIQKVGPDASKRLVITLMFRGTFEDIESLVADTATQIMLAGWADSVGLEQLSYFLLMRSERVLYTDPCMDAAVEHGDVAAVEIMYRRGAPIPDDIARRAISMNNAAMLTWALEHGAGSPKNYIGAVRSVEMCEILYNFYIPTPRDIICYINSLEVFIWMYERTHNSITWAINLAVSRRKIAIAEWLIRRHNRRTHVVLSPMPWNRNLYASDYQIWSEWVAYNNARVLH